MIEIKTNKAGQLHIECSSEFEHLDAIVEETQRFLAPLISDEDLAYQIVLLLTEAVTNAIEHGNANDASKHVFIDLEIHKGHIKICVEDQGEGFDPSTVDNPLKKDNLLHDGGRGIFFIEQMADKVWYEKGGRCVFIQFDRA